MLLGQGSGKVLKSTSEDDIFVNFVDHGALGIIAFPAGELYATKLNEVLRQMSEKNMFRKLAFYLEAGESGTMFQKLPPNINVYGMTATNATESSYAYYCPPDDVVNEKHVGACLGDLYSVNWMENTDANPSMTETVEEQYTVVKKETWVEKPTFGQPGGSHVMQFGDLSVGAMKIGSFQGHRASPGSITGPSSEVKFRSAVNSRDVDLVQKYNWYMQASREQRPEAARVLNAEISARSASEDAFKKLAAIAYPMDVAKQQQAFDRIDVEPEQPECELAIHHSLCQCRSFDARSSFALQFQRVAVNLCGDADLGWGKNSAKAGAYAQMVCEKTAPALVV